MMKLKKFELKIMLASIILLILLLGGLYLYVKNYSYMALLQEKYLIKYMLFNLIFLANILFMMSEKYAKYWYISYIIQIILLIYLNRNLLIRYNIEDMIFLGVLIYCLGLFGYLFFEMVNSFSQIRYANGIEKQNKFYSDILQTKNKFLNNLIYFRNIVIIRFGAHEIPENPSVNFWLFHSVLVFIVFLLSLFNAFKILLSLAVFFVSLSLKYDTLHSNYKDSSGFKKNFDVNTRYWLIKLRKNDSMGLGGSLIKRYYSGPLRESIKFGYDKMAITYTNPKLRTVLVIGGAVFAAGTVGVVGYCGGKYIEQNGQNTRHKMTIDAEERRHARQMAMDKMTIDAEESRHTRQMAMDKFREEQKTERAKAKHKSILDRFK